MISSLLPEKILRLKPKPLLSNSGGNAYANNVIFYQLSLDELMTAYFKDQNGEKMEKDISYGNRKWNYL